MNAATPPVVQSLAAPVASVAPQFEAIPPTVRALPSWCVWRYGSPDEQGKRKKPPCNPNTGNDTDATRGHGWSFAACMAAYQARPDYYAGVGLMLRHALGLVAIDLDHCRDPHSGKLSELAERIVAAISTYWEISPSGCGLRGLALGKVGRTLIAHAAGIEVYASGRYVTITGQHLAGTPTTLRPCQAAIDALYQEHGRTSQEGSADLELPDAGDLARCYQARQQFLQANGLPRGIRPDSQTALALAAHKGEQAALDTLCQRWPFLSDHLLKGDGEAHCHMLRAIVMNGLRRFAGYPYAAAAALFWHFFASDACRPGRGVRWLEREIARCWQNSSDPPKGYRTIVFSGAAADAPLLTITTAPRQERAGRPARLAGPTDYLTRLQADADAGATVLASVPELAARYGVSVRTIQRYEAPLIAAGQIRRVVVRKGRASYSFVEILSGDKPSVSAPEAPPELPPAADPVVVTNLAPDRAPMLENAESPQCIGNTVGGAGLAGPEDLAQPPHGVPSSPAPAGVPDEPGAPLPTLAEAIAEAFDAYAGAPRLTRKRVLDYLQRNYAPLPWSEAQLAHQIADERERRTRERKLAVLAELTPAGLRAQIRLADHMADKSRRMGEQPGIKPGSTTWEENDRSWRWWRFYRDMAAKELRSRPAEPAKRQRHGVLEVVPNPRAAGLRYEQELLEVVEQHRAYTRPPATTPRAVRLVNPPPASAPSDDQPNAKRLLSTLYRNVGREDDAQRVLNM